MDDPLPEIKARHFKGRYLPSDAHWLLCEVERLRKGAQVAEEFGDGESHCEYCKKVISDPEDSYGKFCSVKCADYNVYYKLYG